MQYMSEIEQDVAYAAHMAKKRGVRHLALRLFGGRFVLLLALPARCL